MLQYKEEYNIFRFGKCFVERRNFIPIILEKGQKIDLTKGQPKVAKLQGWLRLGSNWAIRWISVTSLFEVNQM